MKALHGVKDANGQPQKGWSFGTFKDAWNCGGNIQGKGRRISGWQLRSPDGVLRLNEGNWQQFVPFARLVIANYGCTSTLS